MFEIERFCFSGLEYLETDRHYPSCFLVLVKKKKYHFSDVL